MLIDAARRAIHEALAPDFRRLLLRSLALTLGALGLIWIVATRTLAAFAHGFAAAHPVDRLPWYVDVVTWGAGLVSGSLLFIGLSVLIAPITALIASLFLDEVADKIERADYPADPPGRAMPLGPALWNAITFTLAVIAVNLVCLVLLLVPGVNLVAFFIGNGYLLGREYFELAASRFHSRDEVRALRRRHAGALFLAGLIIAGLIAVPILNLLAPFFATIFMVHVNKALTGTAPQALDAGLSAR